MSERGALYRMVRRSTTGRPFRQPCELCGQAIPNDHRHLLDVHDRELRCVCRSCSVLFQRDEAGQNHYQLVPDHRIRLDGLSPADLGVPVGLAFFVRSADGRIVAHYPSPAGATRWEIDPATWESTIERCADVAEPAADVEALLVNTTRDRSETWRVPIDDCYRLVAIVRRHWAGMTGGDRVWLEIERFFDELRRRHGTDSDG